MKVFSSEDVLELLRHNIARAGSQATWARQTGIRRTQINMALNGRRMPHSRLCQALGLEWVIVRHVAGKNGQPRPVIIDSQYFLTLLKAAIKKAGSISAWARETGIDRPSLNEVILKRRAPSRKILAALNLSEVLIRTGRQDRAPRKRQRHARW